MKKTIWIFILFSSMIFILWYGRVKSPEIRVEPNVLPIEAEVLKEILPENDWLIADSNVNSPYNIFHIIEKGGQRYLIIGSYDDQTKRSVVIQAYPNMAIDISQHRKMIKLACDIYGVTDAEFLSEKIGDYTARRDPFYGKGILNIPYGELFFQIVFDVKENENRYDLHTVALYDLGGAEYLSVKAKDILITQLGYRGVEARELSSLDEIEAVTDKEYEIVALKGTLHNIKNAKENELPSFTVPTFKEEPHFSDYETAMLVAGQGERKIWIRQRLWSKEILQSERIHYCFRNVKNDELVCFASLKPDQD